MLVYLTRSVFHTDMFKDHGPPSQLYHFPIVATRPSTLGNINQGQRHNTSTSTRTIYSIMQRLWTVLPRCLTGADAPPGVRRTCPTKDGCMWSWPCHTQLPARGRRESYRLTATFSALRLPGKANESKTTHSSRYRAQRHIYGYIQIGSMPGAAGNQKARCWGAAPRYIQSFSSTTARSPGMRPDFGGEKMGATTLRLIYGHSCLEL